ncbi:MAG: cation:proton antiporter subunit C [Promicromonosporaceae bacterium]|nr:cation:proton antiporter subunit C [Promicromonosporaceae bacterium]
MIDLPFDLSWLDGASTAVVLFFVGLAGVVLRKNMMITVIATGIMSTAIILAFVTMGSSPDHLAPMTATDVASAADPVPQALMITSVVIGVAVKAVCLVLILGLYRQHKTLDWDEARAIREAEGEDTAAAPLTWRERLDVVRAAFRPADGTAPPGP